MKTTRVRKPAVAAVRSTRRARGDRGTDATARAAETAADVGAAHASAEPMIRVPMTVRWDDLDAFNHVNNATFLVYAQEARLAWLATIDGPWFDATMMPVVAAVQTNFRRQLAWPGSIVVELAATRVGTSSLTLSHRIRAATDVTCVHADGEVVMVWIDPTDGRPVPLPTAIRSVCQSPREPSAAMTSK